MASLDPASRRRYAPWSKCLGSGHRKCKLTTDHGECPRIHTQILGHTCKSVMQVHIWRDHAEMFRIVEGLLG